LFPTIHLRLRRIPFREPAFWDFSVKLRVLRRSSTMAMVLAAAAFAACGDDQVGSDVLGSVEAGLPKDSLLALMGTGPLSAQFADTMRLERGYRISKYLMDGKLYEVLYFREKPGNVRDPVEQALETPVLLADGKVLGWGWEYYVEEGMGKLKLPTPLREVEAPAAPAAPAAPGTPGASADTTKR
jgi:hypothetical protein